MLGARRLDACHLSCQLTRRGRHSGASNCRRDGTATCQPGLGKDVVRAGQHNDQISGGKLTRCDIAAAQVLVDLLHDRQSGCAKEGVSQGVIGRSCTQQNRICSNACAGRVTSKTNSRHCSVGRIGCCANITDAGLRSNPRTALGVIGAGGAAHQ